MSVNYDLAAREDHQESILEREKCFDNDQKLTVSSRLTGNRKIVLMVNTPRTRLTPHPVGPSDTHAGSYMVAYILQLPLGLDREIQFELCWQFILRVKSV